MKPTCPEMLSDMEWSFRIRRYFREMGLLEVDDLLSKSEGELLRHPGFGLKSLKTVNARLAEFGLALARWSEGPRMYRDGREDDDYRDRRRGARF